ncbi:unnamed protein product [Timema podura]|uniref:Elapor1-like galactose binding domain-containing protein n=1 Tax=Timema podura TaxID=61482 RepID=A0ABN7PGK7_TIMPD|nr:unnamed protein product [Timema podura]
MFLTRFILRANRRYRATVCLFPCPGISCEAGYYFDLGDLTCRMCHPGTFSLGGGVLFDTWEDLPQGFYTQVESFRSSFASAGRFTVDVNCSRYGWQPSGDFMASLGGPCAATLTYTVHLVKPGNLSYVYQYSDKDVIFDFEVTFTLLLRC